jgi:hypothetical protein
MERSEYRMVQLETNLTESFKEVYGSKRAAFAPDDLYKYYDHGNLLFGFPFCNSVYQRFGGIY